ncbi:MAG: dihydrolipoamide acetyltransferase family protein [Halanaerobiales bacterium]|nr:dihydrolipoamide acetyltransferase family protein [Halanaerobiales bacterium]
MGKELLMPKLGLTMEEGTLIEWYVHKGDTFKTGDLLFSVETEKLTNDVEANEDGEILEILVQEGETVKVKTPVARLVGYEKESAVEKQKEENNKAEKEEKVEKNVTQKEKKEPSKAKVMAAPKTRKFATDNDVDLNKVAEKTGKNNISVSDIKKYLQESVEKKEETAPADKKASSSMRKIIGEKLTESWRAPHIYLKKEIKVEALLQLKETFAKSKEHVSLNDIISFITVKTIKNYMKINSLENNSKEFEVSEDINLGLAVAVEDGLLVPVVKNADQYSLQKLAHKSKDLILRTKENRLSPDEMQSGTFTITNLGMFGIDEFTAILNPPQAAILAVGTIKDKLYLDTDDKVKSIKVINFTLGVDHRAIDGAAGAKFMQKFAEYIENPYLCF